MKLPIVVLISGNGSNLQAIIDAAQQDLAVEIRAVISSRSDALGLQRAKQAGIPAHVIKNETGLAELIDSYGPQIIALAGYMRRLSPGFVQHYAGRIINIHPSLLPKYPGLDTHKRVLQAQDRRHGVTIHFVTQEVDAGPIICQAQLNVGPQDNEDTLKARIHALEHKLYPQVLSWLAAGRLQLNSNGRVTLDGEAIHMQLI